MRQLPIVMAALLAGYTAVCPALASDNVVVIANPGVTVDTLPLASLRATYSMRVRHWSDGTPIQVFVLPDRDSLHAAFSKEVLRIYPYVLRNAWDRVVFTGTGRAPVEVASQQEMLQRVSTTPGAIGYVQDGKVSNEKIKILQVR